MQKAVVLFAVALMAMLSVATAKADSVLYATWGTFANPGTGFTINNAAVPGGTSTIHDGSLTGSTITFTGVTNEIDPPSESPLGIFMTSTPLSNGEIDNYNGTTFTVTVDQLNPGTGIGTVAGTLSGVLRKGTNGAGASTLHIAWNGQSVTLNGVTYSPEDLDVAGASFTTPTTLQGNITAVPVPASVIGGAGLFGLIASAKLLRRKAA